jgi:hypothetical protein
MTKIDYFYWPYGPVYNSASFVMVNPLGEMFGWVMKAILRRG